MAVVYEATQLSLERRVALKVLGRELSSDREFRARFAREGKLQASLEHPHVLTVYEAGESDHGLYLAMRLVRGPTLAELLRAGGLDAERALGLLGQVAGALDAAHAAGLVHRDVKPQNVLVDDGEHAYLADFGLTNGSVTTATSAADRRAFAAMLLDCLGRDERLSLLPELAPTALVTVSADALGVVLEVEPGRREVTGSGRRRLHLVVTASAVTVVAGVALTASLGGGGGERGGADAPPPPAAKGAVTLGSELAPGRVRSVDCTGGGATPNSPACTLLQTRLPGRPVVVRRNGLIVGWAVRGARGELALQVLRPRGAEFVEASRSRFELTTDAEVQRFPATLPVRRGDQVGVEFAPGAAIGVRGGPGGAATARWLDPLHADARAPSLPPGSGLDREILLRVEYVPGRKPRLPRQVTGIRAARAAEGRELGAFGVELRGQARRLAAVALPERVALDLFKGERRVARLQVPDADPRGALVTLRPVGTKAGLELSWMNPGSEPPLVHHYRVTARGIEFID
jgi:tRNA A-37 threonylcarbamoyl transferase component Bud32